MCGQANARRQWPVVIDPANACNYGQAGCNTIKPDASIGILNRQPNNCSQYGNNDRNAAAAWRGRNMAAAWAGLIHQVRTQCVAARAYLARQLKDRPSVRGEAALIDLTLAEGADPEATLHDLKHITDQLLVRNPSYRCGRCGFGARTHHWQCPSCKEWGSIKPLLNYAVV